jgi:hypothetical protein
MKGFHNHLSGSPPSSFGVHMKFNLTSAARDRKLKVKLTTGPIGSFAHCGDRVTSSLSPKNSGG